MKIEKLLMKTFDKMIKFCNKVSKKNKYQKLYDSVKMSAFFAYMFNLTHENESLENCVQKLSESKYIVDINEPVEDIVYFDSFGLSNRGLTKVYFDAFIKKGYKFTYITYSGRADENEIIMLTESYDKVNVIMIEESLESLNYIYSILDKTKNVFLYIRPEDTLVLAAAYQTKPTKYLINLTDHAFWLGSSVLDYSLEFRDYGYNVSVQKRKIDKSKLIKLPYYPLYKKVAFQGYPLKNMNKENTIVSGGSLYKTINDDLLFYKMIEQILEKHTDMYFWYLGNNGDDTYLKELQARFEGRVVHTSERIDLMELLKNSKLYLSTYPIAGALMTQYSALAGIPCLTIVNDQDATGLLAKSGKEVFEYENSQELLEDADKLLSDKVYYDERVKNLSNLIITEEKFADELEYILNNKCGRFEFKEFKAETENLQKSYIERFKYNDYLSLVTNKKFTMFSVFYKEYFKRLLFKIFKINK